MADNNWQTDTLANICDSIDYGLTESAKTLPVGPKFLRITDIVDGHIDWATVPYCKVAEEEIEKYKIHHGDIVIARTGATTGYSIYVKNPPIAVFASYLVRYKVKKEFDGQFVSYFLKSPDYWEYIRGVLGDKSAQPNASASTIAQVKINYPLLPEQRAIAEVLGTLDDKIELNRRMNRTLESMARAVFRQWFVDGDDVGDWEVGQIKDLGEVITGKTPPTNDRENYDGETPFITIPDMHGKMFVIETGKTLSEKGVQTQRNKTLPPFSICISCIATPGLVSMTTEPSQTNQQINSLIPNDKKSAFYSFFALRELGDEIRARGGGGSVLLNLNKGQFEAMPIPIPSVDLMHKFHEFAEPLLLRLLANEKESRTLASLRDSLLPKLMRGEVRVR